MNSENKKDFFSGPETESLSEIELRLIEATRNDQLGWPAVDLAEIGPDAIAEPRPRFGWQHFIVDEVRESWGMLPLAARLVAFLTARQQDYFSDSPS